MYNAKVRCIKSGDVSDVVVGGIYTVTDGFLHTNYCPWAREQKDVYGDIGELNEYEKWKGNEFIEI